jgi:hypothetical protein
VSVKADWSIGSPENVVRIPPERHEGRLSHPHWDGDEFFIILDPQTTNTGVARIDRPHAARDVFTR